VTTSTISGTYSSGINLSNGNYSDPVTVTSTGSVSASGYGLAMVASSSWTVVNAGQISGYWGIDLFAGGSITNQAGGSITGAGIGVYLGSPGGSVSNQAGATIAGRYGVWISSGTVENAGTITDTAVGSGYAVRFGGGVNRLIIDPGAVFNGNVYAVVGGTNTIELASGASAGTLSGLGAGHSGAHYQNFQTVTIDSGAAWTIAATAAGFGGVTIEGFRAGDKLDLTDVAYAAGDTVTLDSGSDVLTVYDSGHTVLATVQLSGDFSGKTFVLSSDGSVGTDIARGPSSQITGTYGSGIALTSTYYTNPVTVTSTGNISAATGNGLSAGSSWTIQNNGTVASTTGAGVALTAGGALTNAAGGSISGGTYGAQVTNTGSIDNAGSMSGTVAGAEMGGAGTYLLNESGGSIVGSRGVAILEASGPQTVVNDGSITGTAGSGILVQANGANAGGVVITNGASGVIHGANDGIATAKTATKGGNPASVDNSGTITGLGAHGILLAEGGTVTNETAGVISGKVDGVNIANAAGTVGNFGHITGSQRYGVILGASGSVTNGASGVITGQQFGVTIRGASATVENAGSISGGRDSVYLGGTGTNRLIVDAGAVFTGKVAARGVTANNTLELTNNNGPGTLSGLGSHYVGFHNITIDSGASWAVAGTVAGFRAATIGGIGPADTLDLTNLTFNAGETATLMSGNQLAIRNAKLKTILLLNLAKTDVLTGDIFHVASDGSGGTLITVTASGSSSTKLAEAVAAHSAVLSAFSGSLSALLQPHNLQHTMLAISAAH
jgi:hypothetical protein